MDYTGPVCYLEWNGWSGAGVGPWYLGERQQPGVRTAQDRRWLAHLGRGCLAHREGLQGLLGVRALLEVPVFDHKRSGASRSASGLY